MRNGSRTVPLIRRLALICAGAFLSAVVLNGLYLPNQLLSGGIAGIAMLLHLTLSWDVALVTFLINLPIFLVGYVLMDRKYILYSVIGMLALSASLKITENMPVISEDPLVVIALGGAVYGFSISLVVLQHGSCGGNDIITRILHKYFSIPLGSSTLAINVSILGASIYFFGVDRSVITLIANFVYSMVLNYFSEKRFAVKMFLVETDRKTELLDGCEKMEIEYMNPEGGNLLILYSLPKMVPAVRNMTMEADPAAIFSVSTADAVRGRKMFTDRLYKNTDSSRHRGRRQV